jgi:hypothetical protein
MAYSVRAINRRPAAPFISRRLLPPLIKVNRNTNYGELRSNGCHYRRRSVCQHLTRLVERAQRCYVAQCEHGTIHLVWRRTALQFHSSEFLGIAQTLKCWSTSDDLDITGDSCVRLYQRSSGWMQLWLCGVGLNLAPLEVHALIVMVSAAALQLRRAQAQAVSPLSQLAAYQPVQAIPNPTWPNN